MKQERRIIYQAGITRTPSDFLCKDGELAECVNLVTDHEELKPVVMPKELSGAELDNNHTLLYVHRRDEVARYIVKVNNVTTIQWTTGVPANDSVTFTTLFSESGNNKPVVTSIGNTLIIATPTGLHYFLWDQSLNGGSGGYKSLGSKVPGFEIAFSLYTDAGSKYKADYPEKYIVMGENMLNGIVLRITHAPEYFDPEVEGVCGMKWADDGGYDRGKDALIGLVSSRLEKLKEDKKFAFPFWARAAVRLYDGSYTHVSPPFLLLPTVLNNWNIYVCDDNGAPKRMNNGWNKVTYAPYGMKLGFNISASWGDDWEDIIKGIDIFVSDEVKSFDMEGTWEILNSDIDHTGGDQTLVDTCKPEYAVPEYWYRREDAQSDTGEDAKIPSVDLSNTNTWRTYFRPKLLSQEDLTKKLVDASVFYKIAELDFSAAKNGGSFKAEEKGMDSSALKNLVTLPQLKHDENFSYCDIVPKVMKSYNGRLHIANYTRSIFQGFRYFSYTKYQSDTYGWLRFLVHIRTEEGERTILSAAGSNYWASGVADVWFFYPDPRAYQVDVYNDNANSILYSLTLKEHPWLNGAYHFGHIPTGSETRPAGTSVSVPVRRTLAERLENHLLVSEVINPFLFTARNDHFIDRGAILGLATQSTALGAEEHGLHQMTVFSERGISTLEVNKEGGYSSVSELPREVCINPDNIIETDGAIFFVSKKGLMMIVGNKVTCVTEQMNGMPFSTKDLPGLTAAELAAAKEDSANPLNPWNNSDSPLLEKSRDIGSTKTFLEFIREEGTRIAYDYVDARLLIISTSTNYDYAYSLADGTVSKVVLPTGSINSVVSDYPDCLLQSGGKLYTLYDKDREDQVSDRQRAFLVTRPMKLAGPDAVSSLRELVNVGMWQKKDAQGNEKSCVKTEVWLSDDLYNWYPMESRFGAAAKYFRIGLYINMLPTERLSGTIIMEQERRTDNQRA